MTSLKFRPLALAVLLIASSLAGCTGESEQESTPTVTPTDTSTNSTSIDNASTNDTSTVTPTILGNVLTSTYHVQDLVETIGGSRLNVQMIGPSNIPVHDYEPTAADLLKLKDIDMFFYHGLGLEPWVDASLASFGSDAPKVVSTHTMPSGEVDLDFEVMLIQDLCEHLSDGPFESSALVNDDVLGELHAEHVAHRLSFPVHDDDGHEDHSDHEDHSGHDNHSGDDVHEGHNHAEAEETIANPPGCPTDSVIQIYHLEKGEHILEFETEDAISSFDMVVLKMPGGHAHHHHGHGSGPYEWAGIFSISDSAHTWTMEKVGGSYADPAMKVVIIPTDTPTEGTMHTLEEGAGALIEGDSCVVVQDGGTMTPIAPEGSCFELTVGTGDMSTFNMDTTGMTGFAAFTAHSPYEFENTQHYLKDSKGNDVEHVAEEGGGGHGDHGDHGDNHEGECHNTATHQNYESTEEDCEAAGHTWMDEDDHNHDGHEGECHNTTTHQDYESTEEDCEAAGHTWMGEDDHRTPEEIMEEYDVNNDSRISWDEFWIAWNSEDDHDNHNHSTHEDNDENHSDHDDHADHDDHDDHNHSTHDDDHDDHGDEISFLMDMFNQSDADGDQLLNLTELETFMHELEELEDEHREHDGIYGTITLHVEAEGDYGFALPHDVTMHILASHDDHSDHDDHGDDHGEEGHGVCHDMSDHTNNDIDNEADCEAAGYMWMEEDGHDEEEEAMHDEDEARFDPHSWLDPLAYKAQVVVVRDSLIETFPDGEIDFRANANALLISVTDLDNNFKAAIGEGVCSNRDVIANHNAYAYMAERYDLEFITVHGLDPEGEPSAADIKEVVDSIAEKGITVFFVEEYTSVSAVQSIVEQTQSDTMPNGIKVLILHTMELSPKNASDNYVTLMTKNLESLQEGLGC